MSIPTFNGTSLCTRAAREQIDAADVRVQIESMPGVNGQFVQTHGTGGRDIRVEGILDATGASAAAAHQSLKTALRTLQSLADGATVATYGGTDGTSYVYCILLTVAPSGQLQVSREGASTYRAMMGVAASLRQLEP